MIGQFYEGRVLERKNAMKLAICPGSFDPVTIGHLDIIGRARKIFDHVIVAVMVNPEKHTMFTTEERIALIQKCTKDMEDVEVVSFDGLFGGLCQDAWGNCDCQGVARHVRLRI